jgi:hypothetical protein
MDSLQIIENFCGQDLDAELVQRLASGPQEHIVSVVAEHLTEPWYDWYDKALQDDSGLDDFHFTASDRWGSDTGIMPASEYKKLALYYPKIGIPDPLAWILRAQVEVATLVGSVDREKLQENFTVGLGVLAEIAPLIKMGAFKLIPHLFAGLHPKLQAVARTELEKADPKDRIPGSERGFLASEYAIMSAMAGTLGSNPVASNLRIWNEMQKGVAELAKRSDPVSLAVQHAFVKFDIPGVTALPMNDLVALRRDSRAFGEFREKLGSTIIQADTAASESPEIFQNVVRDHLESARSQCEHEARTSSALEAFVLPTSAGFLVGATTLTASETKRRTSKCGDFRQKQPVLQSLKRRVIAGFLHFVTQSY